MRLHALLLCSILTPVAISQVAAAPCFESNLGTQIGFGDDIVFPASNLGFTFNYAGVGHTAIEVSSNGFVWLGANANFNSRCCAGTGAQFVMDPPSIAILWTDINADSGSNGVWFNALPGRAVITWDNVVEYGTSGPRFTLQMQLTVLGEVTFWYGPTTSVTATYHTIVAGITPGNNVANPGSMDLSAAFPYVGATQPTVYEEFVGGAFDLIGLPWELIPSGTNGWLALSRAAGCPIVPGSFTPYGAGCPLPVGNPNPEFYEFFANGPSFDLTNIAIEMIPSGNGYLVMAGSMANWFSGFTNGTGISDDQTIPVNLPFSFPHPGGTTSAVGLCSNGFVHLSNDLNSPYFSNVADFQAGPPRIFGCWTDWYRPGAGEVYSDQVNATTWAFTWSGVAEFANSFAGGTWQMQLEANGRVTVLYQSMNITAHPILVGYSRGNNVPDPGNTDLSVSMPFVTATGQVPLLLTQHLSNPVIGQNYPLRISQQPQSAAAAFLIMGFSQIPNGQSLASLGMPNCNQYLSLDATFFSPVATPFTVVNLALPNSPLLLNFTLFFQAAEFAPGVNPLGVAVSNGAAVVIGNF